MRIISRHKKLISLLLILGILIIGMIFSETLFGNNVFNNNYQQDKNEILQNNNLNSENIFSGIGAAWNITHWANRTENDLSGGFSSGSFDNSPNVPIGNGWIGYQMDAKIENLHDQRNWDNGTFTLGADDGDGSVSDNDNELTANNQYQNWTFNSYDNTFNFTNPMSGNYFSNIVGHDCLELRMDGEDIGSNRAGYDNGDKAWWSTYISVPRGDFIDGELRFDVKTDDCLNINSWKLKFHINNKIVYSIGIYDLERFCNLNWVQINVPLKDWLTDPSQIFPTQLNQSEILLNVSLEYTVGTTWYQNFENRDSQVLYIDNIELNLESEVKPSQIGLKMENEDISDTNRWGSGEIVLKNRMWNGSEISDVNVNFSCTDTWTLSDYDITFNVNLNLYTTKSTPDSNYELNANSFGTKFTAEDGNLIQWEGYGYIAIPTGYSETKMRIEFPSDIIITEIFSPKDPDTNVISSCSVPEPGVIEIPINSIESSPSGFWKFGATSPNYCKDINVFNNKTGSWIQSNEFFSGEYINITSEISITPIVSDHLDQTKALLKIRFPNGNIWEEKTQIASVDEDGLVQFNVFKIPESPPNYEAGTYDIILMWNNSYNNFQLNETGIKVEKFSVTHDSILTPEKETFVDITEGDLVNLRVSFNDKGNLDSIENALVYTYNFTDTNNIKIFNEINPGIYLLEFNTIGAEAGINEITIWANSSNYKNSNTTTTLEITKQTTISANATYLPNAPYNQNFTIQFNYTETYFGDGIAASDITTDWESEYKFDTIYDGVYTLTCNASGINYEPGNLYTLIINIEAENYLSKSLVIRVYISELATSLNLFLNGLEMSQDQLESFEFWESINITVEYTDNLGNHLPDSTLKANIGSITYEMDENETYGFYNLFLNASDLGIGIEYLSISANKTFYNPQSFRVVIRITERLTSMEVFLNDIDKTIDPAISLPRGSILNITVNYKDSFNSHISNATLSLFGDYSDTLIENETLEHYSLIINTSIFDFGVKIITLSANLETYEFQTLNLRVNIRKLAAVIQTISGENSFEIRPGQDVSLRIFINSTDFEGYLKSATLSYTWEFGTGTLEDEDGDGIFILELNNIPEGAHKLYLNGFAGENYQINQKEITISAVRPFQDFLLLLIIMIITLIVITSLSIYLILYRRILRFPKPIRKVKKYRKSLDSESGPKDVLILKRKDAFRRDYKARLESVSKDIAKKSSEPSLKKNILKDELK